MVFRRLFGFGGALVFASSVVFVSTESAAWAQEPKQEPNDSAVTGREEQRKALYKEGVALADAGRWEEALSKFASVVELRSAPAALLALGTAQEKTGKLLAAMSTYQKAADGARAAGDAELTQQATSSHSALMARIPRIFIHLPDGAADAVVTIDGSNVSASQQGTLVDPGAHRVVVQAPRRGVFEQRFDLARFEHRDVMVTFEAPAAPRAATTAAPTPAALDAQPAPLPPTSRSLLGPAIVGGFGLVATAGGLVMRLRAQSDYDAANVACVMLMCTNPADAERGNAARDQMRTGTIIAGVGIAALAGAAVWWLLPSLPDAKSQAALAPFVAPGSAGLAARGSF